MSAIGFSVSGLSASQWELALWVFRTAGLAVAMLVLALALRHWRRSHERDAQRMFEQLDLLRAELLSLQDRLDHPPTTAASPMTRAPQPEPRATLPAPAMPSPRGYEVAARLARGGATLEELISSCGLSRHEAQLVLRLHRKPEPVPAVPKEVPSTAATQDTPPRRARLAVVG